MRLGVSGMEIFKIMDCVDCPSYKYSAPCLTADPYYSAPGEAECGNGDFGGMHPCGRMLGAIADMICDGQLETADGYFGTGECLAGLQKDGEIPRGVNFLSSVFWWVKYDGTEAKPYKTAEEIYNEWF
jgi:hypothetical protein